MADQRSQVEAAITPVSSPPMSLARKILIGLVGIAIIAVLLLSYLVGESTEQIDRNLRADQVGGAGREFNPVPRGDGQAEQVVARPGNAPAQRSIMDRVMPGPPPGPASTPIRHFQARARPQGQQTVSDPGAAAQVTQGGSGGAGDAIDQKLGAGRTPNTVVATMLPNRHLFVTMGTFVPCIFEQPVNTDVPGPFTCYTRGNVMSTSGAVSLLDDGTKVVGRIAESLGRGQRRTFGVVMRMETPTGCIVNLRAPISDQLGTSGLDGEVDTHFFERFRGHAVMALFDIASQTAAIAAANAIGGGNGVSFNSIENSGRQLGEGTVGDDINIPSTLKRPQAKRITVSVIEDLDMSNCYKLRTAK